jgi:hypothetical protein
LGDGYLDERAKGGREEGPQMSASAGVAPRVAQYRPPASKSASSSLSPNGRIRRFVQHHKKRRPEGRFVWLVEWGSS